MLLLAFHLFSHYLIPVFRELEEAQSELDSVRARLAEGDPALLERIHQLEEQTATLQQAVQKKDLDLATLEVLKLSKDSNPVPLSDCILASGFFLL